MILIKEHYDVIIVGGGITGASLLFAISRYSNVKSVLLLEKYEDLATLNSNSCNNAQTLHFGNEMTNYSVEKVEETAAAARLVLNYAKLLPKAERDVIIRRCQKMVLAVGDEEAELLEKFYAGIHGLFPRLKLAGRKEIARLEPNVVKGRDKDEKVLALPADDGYMTDFGLLTRSFVAMAKQNRKIRIVVKFNTRVVKAEKSGDGYQVITSEGIYHGGFVVFSTGAYSLLFAKEMGYGRNLSVLSVSGNFYYSHEVLKGKVYRVQRGGIPFAACHADPDITKPGVTRFGPSVTMPLRLEVGHGGTAIDYLKTFNFDWDTAVSMKRIVFSRDILAILEHNIPYGLPFVGKDNFVKGEAVKIVPSLKSSDLWFAKGIGGVRPQVIDEEKKGLVLGEAKLSDDGIVFNITPSPGATSCLAGAVVDLKAIVKHLDLEFYSKRFEKELGGK